RRPSLLLLETVGTNGHPTRGWNPRRDELGRSPSHPLCPRKETMFQVPAHKPKIFVIDVGVRYLRSLRKDLIKPENIIVHNRVRPGADLKNAGLGENASRAWQEARNRRPIELERCDCGWAPQLGTHYRVKRTK